MDLDEVEDENSAEISQHDEILDAAITYKIDGTYPSNLAKDRKRAIRKRAERLEVDKGELFIVRNNGKQKVKIITDPGEQKRICTC